MILFRSVKDERFIVKMAGVLCFSVFERISCFVSVELVILNVSQYVMTSVSRFFHCARLD